MVVLIATFVMVRLRSSRDHQGAAETRKQEQEERRYVARVFHVKAVIRLSAKEITCKTRYYQCGSGACESPSHRGENDRQQVGEPDEIRRKERIQGKHCGGVLLQQEARACRSCARKNDTRLKSHLNPPRLADVYAKKQYEIHVVCAEEK
jgi:hypothetical protein